MMSAKFMTAVPRGGGIGPRCWPAKALILFVPVSGDTARCSGGVVVKNGCADRSGSGLTRRRRMVVFFAMIWLFLLAYAECAACLGN
jgi:hypothetical protein